MIQDCNECWHVIEMGENAGVCFSVNDDVRWCWCVVSMLTKYKWARSKTSVCITIDYLFHDVTYSCSRLWEQKVIVWTSYCKDARTGRNNGISLAWDPASWRRMRGGADKEKVSRRVCRNSILCTEEPAKSSCWPPWQNSSGRTLNVS